MEPGSIPQPITGSPFERAIAIKQEAHALARAGTLDAASPIPVPETWRAWKHDLRRGRLSVLGGFFRFVDLLAIRDVSMGRKLALALIDLATEYVNIALPERRPTVVSGHEQVTEVIEIQQRASWRKVGR